MDIQFRFKKTRTVRLSAVAFLPSRRQNDFTEKEIPKHRGGKKSSNNASILIAEDYRLKGYSLIQLKLRLGSKKSFRFLGFSFTLSSSP